MAPNILGNELLVGFLQATKKEKILTSWRIQQIGIFFFFLFTVTPVAHGSSQARGWIGAAAEAYATDTLKPDPDCMCDLHHNLQQQQVFNPLKKARVQNHILRETTLGL